MSLRRAPVILLPFEHPASDPVCQHLAANLSADLLSELATFEELRVIPASHASAYRVRGEVRPSGAALRVLVRSEAPDGTTLWADRIDAPKGETVELDDAVIGQLAVCLAWRLNREDLLRARDADPAGLTAPQLRLLGADHHQRVTEADTLLAWELLERAVALDPGFAMPYAIRLAVLHGAAGLHAWLGVLGSGWPTRWCCTGAGRMRPRPPTKLSRAGATPPGRCGPWPPTCWCARASRRQP